MRRLDANTYKAEKSELCLRNYERYFSDAAERKVKLLEIGVRGGGSLLMWQDYFRRGTIVGLDLNPCEIQGATGRLHFYQGAQQDCALLDRIRREHAPDGFDIIIDDGSHIGALTRVSFWHLFDNHLKDGGVYAIEDWRTGYWNDWPDGIRYVGADGERSFMQRLVGAPEGHRSILQKVAGRLLTRQEKRRHFSRFPSHLYGMVGVIKELMDELGMDAITDPAHKAPGPHRYPRFRSMEATVGQVFIVKTSENDRQLMAAQQQAYWRSLGRAFPGNSAGT
jgi:hypothetical protein